MAARCVHPGVNKKVQVQLSDLKDEPLEGGAEVVEDPLVKDTPLVVTTNEKDTAVKVTKVTEAVMKKEGEGSPKKRPRRLVAKGLPKVGDRVKMSSAGPDIPCEVVEVREAF